MAYKITIKIKDVDNDDFERFLDEKLEIYADETDSVIEVDYEDIPEGHGFDEGVWK